MSKPTVIMILQAGCPTCALLKPKFDELRDRFDGTMRFEKLDLGRSTPSYDAEIKRVPAFRVEYECNGKQVAKMWCPTAFNVPKFVDQLEAWVTKSIGTCPVKRGGKAKK